MEIRENSSWTLSSPTAHGKHSSVTSREKGQVLVPSARLRCLLLILLLLPHWMEKTMKGETSRKQLTGFLFSSSSSTPFSYSPFSSSSNHHLLLHWVEKTVEGETSRKQLAGFLFSSSLSSCSISFFSSPISFSISYCTPFSSASSSSCCCSCRCVLWTAGRNLVSLAAQLDLHESITDNFRW